MAKVWEFNDIQRAQWQKWMKERPEVIREMAERLPPNLLYRLKSSGQRVTLYSYCENGTVTVLVSGQYNVIVFERRVFGIKPEELEECELPGEGELVGAVYTEPQEVDAFISARIAEMHERGEKHNEARCPVCTSEGQPCH